MQLIADYVQSDKLLPFDRSALAALLTDSSRQAEDQSSLSLHALTLGDLIREAHHHAFQAGDKMVSEKHINTALDHRKYRLGYFILAGSDPWYTANRNPWPSSGTD